MSRTWNAYAFAIAVLAALVAVPLAPATTRPPVPSAQVKQAVHALVIRGEALNRIYGAQLRRMLDPAALAVAWDAGRALSPDLVVEEVLAEPDRVVDA